MDPQNQPPNPQPNQSGIPTVDPLTGIVSAQPVATMPPGPQFSQPQQTYATPPTPLQPLEPPFGGDQPPAANAFPQPPDSPAKSKKRWLLPLIIFIVVVLLLAGAYVFAFLLPNQPSSVFEKSLKNTGSAVDSLATYSNTAAGKNKEVISL